MNFDEWLSKEIEKLDQIRHALKEKHGTVDRDYQQWLFEDAKEPWGFVQRASSSQVGRTSDGNPTGGEKAPVTRNGIVEIMAKWDLIEEEGKLKPRKFLKEGFPELAKELEQHGYRYNAKVRGFLPPWKGVKQ